MSQASPRDSSQQIERLQNNHLQTPSDGDPEHSVDHNTCR
jgi:hypothetical protein